ncbi:aldo/keto reductase [Aliiruegeria sabulilitoris]|uniref:aldo/keto reductase n=1 Tax=Aliiruegeria sabulilitoris TaxID=1510458 RepID=UPI00082E0BA3|nr:aldo/keto reductase [Aliiruegeria sabulilitoris]NDR56014.1 aldo/keto reductase [Pseudoruegeria sp. M32A2M]
MRSVSLPDGTELPNLGLGTWYIGDSRNRRDEEIRALRTGIDLGMNLIDTAEMYGNGASEQLVGEAIDGLRDEVFLVSKVYPNHASIEGVAAACEASLKRLGTDRLDLYLLHWRGGVPLSETVQGFERLIAQGKILRWGVSNFDPGDMDELSDVPGGGAAATNQVLYNLSTRGIEWDLLPEARANGLPIMAYSPVDQARLLQDDDLIEIAGDLGVSAAQLALAWTIDGGGVIAIPKAGWAEHVEENADAAELILSEEIRAELDAIFPPPSGPEPLAIL